MSHFDPVIVDGHHAVIEIARQCYPAFEAVIQRISSLMSFGIRGVTAGDGAPRALWTFKIGAV